MQAWKAVHLKPDSSLRRHAHPVCQLVYNSVYQEAISADESGLICVWKVSSQAHSEVTVVHLAESQHPCDGCEHTPLPADLCPAKAGLSCCPLPVAF